MKKQYILFSFIISIFLVSCTKDKCTGLMTYYDYSAVYMSYDEMRSSVASEAPQVLKNPGKIYFKDNFIFVNEIRKGIHVIDNTDPKNPVNTAFIKIPGNVDIAIRNNILYADSYIDLVALDISDVNNISVAKRIESAFPYPQDGPVWIPDTTKGVVVEWIKTERTEEVDCNTWSKGSGPIVAFNGAEVFANNYSGNNSTGTGGSMARFTIAEHYLYTVDNNNLRLFNISNIYNPSFENKLPVGFGIETIFPYMNKLFIGSQTGMFIYDIGSPSNPQKMGSIQHVNACDPVVVDGNYAYITLRAGNACQGFTNQLEVVNISNPYSPVRLEEFEMDHPYGLGIRNKILFICEGDKGLKVFDVNDIMNIDKHKIAHLKNLKAYDVIPLQDRIMVIGEDGLYQYDYSDVDNIKELSRIPVARIKS